MAWAENHRRYRGDVSRLMVVMGAAIACFGMLLLAIIAYAGWSSNQAAAERERQLVENAVNRSILAQLNEQKSIAWWDDAMTNIRSDYLNLEWIDGNFGYFLTETYGHDEVYILGPDLKPVYAFFEGERRDSESFQLRANELAAVVAEVNTGAPAGLTTRPNTFEIGDYQFLSAGSRRARWGGHILKVNGHAAVVAAMTIEPNIDMNLARAAPHMLVSVRFMDEELIKTLGESLLLPDLALRPAPMRGDGIVAHEFIGDDGASLGVLSWKTRRPGHVLLTVILPLVALGIVLALIAAFNMLRRLRRASNELAAREASAIYQAKHDSLSGLPNRPHFVERLGEFFAARGSGELPAGARAIVAYIDVDRFKDINDTLGHHAGDQLIKVVAERLQARLRPEDFLARFGGDEFAILCAPANADGGAALGRRVARAFASPFVIDGQNVRVTASVGIAVAPDHGQSVDDVMRHADIALYEAKAQGRDRAVHFTMEMAKAVEERRRIEVDLRAALDTDQLSLHYQPLVCARTQHIVGLEALLRWRHPERGDIPPGAFIPIAEDSGLMPALGEWIINRAMIDSKRWPDLEMSINLSPVQFRHVDLEALLRRAALEHEADPTRFILEITEGVLLDAGERTKSMLAAIRAMGFKTALDDFGTGFSSLAYLSAYKFDKIKIDRAFVRGVAKSTVSKSIVQAVSTLGKGLGMDIVAEGVESEAEALMMAHFGCTELQGYLFSKPIPADALDKLLESYEPLQPVAAPTAPGAASAAASATPSSTG